MVYHDDEGRIYVYNYIYTYFQNLKCYKTKLNYVTPWEIGIECASLGSNCEVHCRHPPNTILYAN